MNVILSAISFDLDGHVVVPVLPTSDFGSRRRRVNRTPTLDGGVAINDGGYTDGDRTFVMRWRSRNPAFERQIERLVQLHGRVHISAPSGFFQAAPSDYNAEQGESVLTLLITERVA